MLVIFVFIFIVFLSGIFIYERMIASRPYTGPTTDHFNGRFFNPDVTTRMESDRTRNKSVWFWLLTKRKNDWRTRMVTTSRPPERVHEGIRVTYINHSTVLLQFSGINIITDPIWSRRASPFTWLGPSRYTGPGIAFDKLPPIDIVLLSHNHYDHMDLATLRRIDAAWHPRIYTGLGNAAYLARKGISDAREMDWWDHAKDGAIRIVCAPARHFSARTLSDRNNTLWCGFILETPEGAVYFAGDTGFGAFLKQIEERYSSFRLALLPIGAYKPDWMMHLVHMSPEEAMRAHQRLHIQTSIGIHHSTFRLADDGQDEPGEQIKKLASESSADFRVLVNGESMMLAP